MHREIFEGVHWIQELGPDRQGIARSLLARAAPWYTAGRALHLPQNAYLLCGERTLLLDTLSPAAGEWVVADVEAALGGRPLDYLVISHPDVPHAGNTGRIQRRWPEVRLVAPAAGDTHELYQLDTALKVGPGDRIDLGGKVAVFHEATFLDAALSLWMGEESLEMLFPVDWLGLPIMDGEGLLFADEIGLDADRLYEFHGRVMFWFQYVDVERVRTETDRLYERLAPKIVAPAHGPVIREQVKDWFDAMNEVVARVRETGRVGVL